MVDIKELKKLTDFCRKHGITSLKKGDFELNLSAASLFPKKPTKDEPEIKEDKPFTDEEILLWSAMGVPESTN